MNRVTFDTLWKDQFSREKELFRLNITQSKVFRNLTEMTQCRIVYEAGKIQKFTGLVCNWHKKSHWNTKGFYMYKVYRPRIRSQYDIDEDEKEESQTVKTTIKKVDQCGSVYENLAK